jgi:hypothetical protein
MSGPPSDSPSVSEKRLSTSRTLLRTLVACPLCGKKVSLHFLKYKHVCKQPVEITDEARERALAGAVAHLRRRLGVEV